VRQSPGSGWKKQPVSDENGPWHYNGGHAVLLDTSLHHSLLMGLTNDAS
jgi:hypothetical protein